MNVLSFVDGEVQVERSRNVPRFRPALGFLVLGIVCAGFSVACTAGPEIGCDQPTYEFGTVCNNETVEHTFVVENRGDAVLKIGKLRSCCGAEMNIGSKSIEPGTNTELNVTLSLKGRKGKQRKSFYLSSNDKTNPHYQFKLVGVVSSAVDIKPRLVTFGDLAPSTVTNKTVSIECKAGFGFGITNIISRSENFAATVKQTGGTKHEVDIRTVPPLQKGVTRTQILLHTDNPKVKPLSVSVSATVAGSDFVIVPNRILLSESSDLQGPVSRFLAVRSRRKKQFRILKVDAPDDDIQVRYYKLGDLAYRIDLKNIMPLPVLGGKELVVTTDSPTESILRIPFKMAPTED